MSGGNQATGIELLQQGSTDIHLTDALVWSSIQPKAIVPAMPWLLPTYEDVDSYMQGEGGQAILDALSESGVVALGIGEGGYRQVVNNRNPIRTPSGSGPATVAALGGVLIPAMLTGQSVGTMFMAGVVPGILMGVVFSLAALWYIKRYELEIVTRDKATASERFKSFREALWGIMTPVIILGGIYSGFLQQPKQPVSQ